MRQEINLFEQQLEVVKQEHTPRQMIKKIIEGLLFASNEPLLLQKIKEIVETKYSVRSKEILELIYELQQDYHKNQHAMQIDEIAGGFLLRSSADLSPFIELLLKERRSEKLSKAAMEVLAIITYRSPITRSAIESIRGVDCSGALYSLLDRNLIEITGRLEVPGRPCQYGVTKKFLQHFGLNDTRELLQTTQIP